MKNKSSRKFNVFLCSLFIFLIHLPFVFATSKPHTVAENPSAITAVDEKATSLEKSWLYDSLGLNTLGLSKEAFESGLKGFGELCTKGKIANDDILSIVDFSLSSSKKRLFVIDLKNSKILFNTYVAHGRNSGKEFASKFSNSPESFKSSLGFYVTKDTYNGSHGYSLQLEGEEKGINDNAFKRAIVMHSAWYANENVVRSKGFLGRSLGCPALPEKVFKPIIDSIKNGSCLFLYSPDKEYLSRSQLL